jgi:hypothetical protein
MNKLESITGFDWFGVVICFSQVISLFSGTKYTYSDKVEVSPFVPKLGNLVLSALYFQSSTLSLKCTYLRAFFFFAIQILIINVIFPINASAKLWWTTPPPSFPPFTQNHSDLKTASFYVHQQAVSLPPRHWGLLHIFYCRSLKRNIVKQGVEKHN